MSTVVAIGNLIKISLNIALLMRSYNHSYWPNLYSKHIRDILMHTFNSTCKEKLNSFEDAKLHLNNFLVVSRAFGSIFSGYFPESLSESSL